MENKALEGLNEKQKEALLCTDGAVLVSAGAGSGKTRLLTHRISYLIDNKNVKPYNILAITFTNKAAAEMADRVISMCESGSQVWISTFHSMCARILRADIEKLGIRNHDFTIYSDVDTEKVLKMLLADRNLKDEAFKRISYYINFIKNNNMSLAKFKADYAYLTDIDLIYTTYLDYENALMKNNALDFNDLLLKTYDLFIACPDVLDKYASRFQYVLVDEFQDTNKIQYDLVKLLSSKHKNVFVVGDEDQCIYTWRGANYENINAFKQDFENVKIFKLEQNYRSSKEILSAANKLIKNNSQRIDKNLWTDSNVGNPVEIRTVYDEREEAEIVSREIYDLVINQGYSYSDFAVLMRLNSQTFPFEEKFLNYGIPHRVFGGFKFYERAEIKNLISYLRIFVNPRDEIALLRIINFPKRGIGDGAIAVIKKAALQNNKTLFDVVINSFESVLPASLNKKLEVFSKTYFNLLAEFEHLSLTDFVKEIIKEYSIRSAYNGGSEEEIEKLANIDMFVSNISQFEKDNQGCSLTQFLESISLISDIDSFSSTSGQVTLATIHSVKGLEFRYVFVVGLEEKIFPISRTYSSDSEMEEERRLMYVAITRAKENLMILNCKTRFIYGKRDFMIASRFLTELGYKTTNSYEPELSAFRGANSKPYMSQYKPQKPFENFTPSKPSYSFESTKFDNFIEKTKNNVQAFKQGQQVLHTKFGIGTIIKISDDKTAEIDFGSLGKKTLILEIAPLKIIK